MLDSAYDIFTQRVREGREHALDESLDLEDATTGSIFTAAQAVEMGLVDGIGYLSNAIDDAERRAGIRTGRATVYWLSEPPTLFGGSPFAAVSGAGPTTSLNADEVRSFVNDLTAPQVMYLMR